ncbi:hypothetical protein COY27_06685 [Candidatus Woesearchaeota archaeon CG_4_10_14_0_2_um_filter_33_13]|nr:MAG: hypothetical protein COY27_06685 [Candidatus Woesearchaeota archaeon CG_4_10_14_0_2_um_filter_33_13]
MNEKVLQFLSYLRKDSRLKLTEISKQTGVLISTLFDMLKELQNNIITKSTVIVDFQKLGYHTKAQIFLRVRSKDKSPLVNYLSEQNCVNSIYKTNNGWDLILETVHRNLRDLDKFVDGIPEKYDVENHQIHYLIEDLKKEQFLAEFDNINGSIIKETKSR